MTGAADSAPTVDFVLDARDLEKPFAIELQFMAECCPQCGEAREPGPCPECGVEVGESQEVGEIARTRATALAAVDARLRELIPRFEELPTGNIVVSNDQFATAMSDAKIFVQIAAMTRVADELEGLDVNDPATIGGELRRRMSARVERVETLLETCEDLALFDPQGPAKELRRVAADVGRYGAEVTRAFVAMLVAETIGAVREAEAEAQRLISNIPHGDRIESLSEEMKDWVLPDLDARAALVLGRAGSYGDEYGFLDVGAIFGAFSDEKKPFEKLASCARRYFSHLIGDGAAQDVAMESLLILPAIELASLDRPLAAHRVARSIYELLGTVRQSSPEEVQRLVDRTVAEGPLVFQAVEQIKRGVKLLAAGQAAGVADEGAVLKTVMDAYKELAETSFRTYGRLVTDLDRVRGGKAPSAGTTPPMLHSLTEQLQGSREPAAKRLGDCCDTALRNACGHAEYRWDAGTEEVDDMRTDRRWSVEELEASVAAMASGIAGADAGYTCFLASGHAEMRPPAWAKEGQAGALAGIVAEATFGAHGFRVAEVRDGGLTVVIEAGDVIDKIGLMSVLGGMTLFAKGEDVVQVLDVTGGTVVEVASAAFREAAEAPTQFKDLAILAPFLSNDLRTGDPRRAALEWVTVGASQVLTTALSESQKTGVDVASMLRAADRFGYVVDFARAHEPEPDEELRGLMKRLKRCRSFCFAAARGDEAAAQGFAGELESLNGWIAARGIVWPPE